ncbi:serine/arginine repetitive matrix protein 1 [Trypanosoma grayi]|uniref:serine/arginine repetitive matrix protein 1 n=1 Tax=Trypanosoma grayi TaxID=71804 RepID=UPI0004F4A25C|nr:serine/arginine repetitive matrix protein 1 [Trypanosoma grayi]KEG12446.1 serine/arginine repetitive matrix protein 1 [Trypanosoma grayi]
MAKTAGLSRAYAVLRQLELLRQQDVLDPLPPETDTDLSSSVAASAAGDDHRRNASLPSPARWGPEAARHPTSTTGNPQLPLQGRAEESHLHHQQTATPHHPTYSWLGEKEEDIRGVRSYSGDAAESTATVRTSPPSRPAEGGNVNQALQRVLKEIVAMRKQAGGMRGTAGSDTGNHRHERKQQTGEKGKDPSQSPDNYRPNTVSRLVSPPQDREEDDVFFDDPLYSHTTTTCSTRDERNNKTHKRRERTHRKSGGATDTGVENVYETPCTEGRRDTSTRHTTEELSSRIKSGDVLTSSAVSEYTKSLLSQRRQRQDKLLHEIQQRQEPLPADTPQPITWVEATPPSALLSPISRADDLDEGFSPLPTQVTDLDYTNKELSSQPLMPFLCELTTMGSAALREALRDMEGCCDDTTPHCREWYALTALVNSGDAIRHIVVPMFLAELSEQSCMTECDASDPNSRLSHILSALIGLGERAEAALPILVKMLTSVQGCVKLVALAIRAVGGDDGVRALCRMASSNRSDAAVRAAAVYGISTMAYPVLGHTTVYCLGAPRLSGTIVFYQPPVDAGYVEVDGDGRPRRESSLQLPPPYRPTHVILHAETVRRQLLQFTASMDFRRALHTYETLPLVLQDFALGAPEACRQQGMPEAVQESLRRHESELEDASKLPPRVLPFSYDPCFIGREDEQFAIEETLITILLDGRTPLSVVEQTLVSLASLPGFVTIHVAPPVLDYVIQCVSRYEQQCADESDGGEAAVVAGLVALGRLVRHEGTSPTVTNTACELLLHNLGAPSWRVRHAACIGLGEVGAVSNMPEATARALTTCLHDDAMNHETVAWALARLGLRGVRALLERITSGHRSSSSNNSSGGGNNNKIISNSGASGGVSCSSTLELPVSTRVACVRALAKIDMLEASLGVEGDTRRLREMVVQRLGVAIAAGDIEEDVVLECAYALAEVIGRSSSNNKGGGNAGSSGAVAHHHRSEEAAMYYHSETPNEAFEIMKELIESVVLPFSVQKALLYSLCAYGGAHGELYVSQTAIQSPAVASRAAAAFGLRACGGKVIRTLALALNDDTAEVRLEAFDTLSDVGANSVLAVLRTRPHQHTQQVVAALRDCLLRDMGRSARRQAAQDLYAALTRNRTL